MHLQDFGRRAAGLLGNAVHLGAIAAAALALVAPRLLGRGRLGVAWAAAGVLLATAVQLSGSRSGLVVTIGLLLWALVALGWRTAAVLTGVVVVGFAVGSLLAGSTGGRTAAGRAGETDVVVARRGEPRVLTWRSSLGAIAERPLLGVGPGRFAAATSSRRTFGIAKEQGPDQIFTDGHNLFVEYATTTGLPGALAFLAFLGLAAWRAVGPRRAFALAVLAVGLAEPQFVGTTGVAFLMLGAAAVTTDAVPALPRPGPLRAVVVAVGALGVAAGVALLVGDWHLKQATLDFTPGEARSADRLMRPWPEPAIQLAKIALLRSKARGADVAHERSDALRWREKAIGRNPSDPNLWNDLGELELTFGNAKPAETDFREAQKRNPWSARALNGIGRARIAQDDPDGARPYLQKSLRVLPNQPTIRKLLNGQTP